MTTVHLAPLSSKNFAVCGREGQSLVELIVALAIAVILIVGGVAAITPLLKTTSDVTRIQTGAALGRELLDNVRVLAESNWHAVDALATTSQRKYYLVVTSSPFAVASGTESIAVSTTTYSRYFYLEDVNRAPATPFAPGGGSVYDPSTKKITVVYNWPPAGSSSIVSYLARTRNEAFFSSDWSGGGNQTAAVTATGTNSRFATSSNLDVTTQPGSITIQGF